MTLEQIKQALDAMEMERKSPEELLRMTRWWYHPHLRRIKVRLVGECAISVLFTVFVISFLGLSTQPLWLSLLLVGCNALFLLYAFLCASYLSVLPTRGTMKQSFTRFLRRMKTLVILLRLVTVFMGLTIALILVMTGQVSSDNKLLWFVPPLLVFAAWTFSRSLAWRVGAMREDLRDWGREEEGG